MMQKTKTIAYVKADNILSYESVPDFTNTFFMISLKMTMHTKHMLPVNRIMLKSILIAFFLNERFIEFQFRYSKSSSDDARRN